MQGLYEGTPTSDLTSRPAAYPNAPLKIPGRFSLTFSSNVSIFFFQLHYLRMICRYYRIPLSYFTLCWRVYPPRGLPRTLFMNIFGVSSRTQKDLCLKKSSSILLTTMSRGSTMTTWHSWQVRLSKSITIFKYTQIILQYYDYNTSLVYSKD